MSEEEKGQSTIYPSREVSKETREAAQKQATEDIELDDTHTWLILNKYSVEERRGRKYLDIENLAAKSIKGIHEKAGIELSDEDIPEVFVIAAEDWDQVNKELGGQDQNSMGVGRISTSGRIIAIKERESDLFTAISIYHEMVHAVGRHSKTVSPEGVVGSPERGYYTVSPAPRGLALEEGMATYFSIKFASEDYEELRHDQELLTRRLYRGQEVTKENIEKAVDSEATLRYPTNYMLASSLVKKLINAGGADMERLLLATRVDKSKMKELTDKINETYDNKDAAHKVFSVNFTQDALFNLSLTGSF